MGKGAKIAIMAGVFGVVLILLLIRAFSGNMVQPWPAQETVEYTSPITDEYGIVTGENVESKTVRSWSGFWTWFAAFLTLCILSFLYDDNPFYKFAEHLFVGVSAAYWMVLGFWTTLVPNLFGKLVPDFIAHIGLIEGLEGGETEWAYLIPLFLGLILLMRLSSRGGWISRWPLAFIVGTTAGLNFVQFLSSDFMMQIYQSFKPLIVITSIDPVVSSSPIIGTISNIVIFLGVFCGLIYFFFSVEHKGFFGLASRVGIWILMVSFGASFGFTVMGRIALLVGRMEFLLSDWLRLM
jgi:hypothetical protein